jgi:hypothetical protein
MKRRLFLFAAPAIIAAPSLMRVSAAALDCLPPVEKMSLDWYDEFYKNLRANPPPLTPQQRAALVMQDVHLQGILDKPRDLHIAQRNTFGPVTGIVRIRYAPA